MKLTIKGKGHFTLNKSDFIAAGGEGSVYCKGKTAFKIYSDAKKMIPSAKIGELAVLNHDDIIKPEEILLDEKGKAVGYTMKYVKDTYALCQLFPKVFRDRFRIKPDQMTALVRSLQDIVAHAHQHDILLVDLNEMNFLVDEKFGKIYAIDCDSWQTKSFHATAIMESIRDRHAMGPGDRYNASKGTDWFSFAVVSFQMFIGIHPYKGKHDAIKTIDERMLNNISVLNKEVSVPPVCQPLTNIPQAYLDWYKAVLENGKREAPPSFLQAVIAIQQVVRIAGSTNFNVRKIVELADDIIRFDPAARMIQTSAGIFNISGGPEYALPAKMAVPVLGISQTGKVISAHVEGGKIMLYNVNRGVPIDCDILADAVMACEGNIFGKSGDKLFQLLLLEPSNSFIPMSHLVSTVSVNATKVYDGIVLQDLLGACYASLMPVAKTCYQIHLKELDGSRVVDAKYESKVVIAVAFKNGKYDKYIFRLNEDYDAYDLRMENDVGAVSPNFVVLPGTGVTIHLNEKEELELFSNAMGSSRLKVFDDPMLSGDMRIMRDGTQAMFAKGNHLYGFEVKK